MVKMSGSPYNRTIEELKFSYYMVERQYKNAYNRTIEELKYRSHQLPNKDGTLIIVP